MNCTPRMLRGMTVLVTFALLAFSGSAAWAKSAKKQNLVELLSHTESIVVGTVTDKKDGFQDGLPYTEITLDVARSLKGDHGDSYSFRQFGLIEPRSDGNGRINLMVTPEGWPVYAKGEQVMLFLHKAASQTGLRSTAGLGQGKFSIRNGRIANELSNESLFDGVSINANLTASERGLVTQRVGAYPSAEFLSFIERAVKEGWVENGVLSND